MTWRDGSWDRCTLGGDQLPGVVRVWVTPARDVQSVPSPGKDAPALKDQGYRGAQVKIELDVWINRGDDSRLREAARILAKLSPRRPGGVAEPLAIVHPATAMAGVQHVHAGTYTIPPPNGRTGILTIPITAQEWFPEEETDKPAQQGTTPAGGADKGAAGIGDGGPLGDSGVPEPDPENLGADFP